MSAYDDILKACRKGHDVGGFKTGGLWGMRTKVAPGGFHGKETVPCAVIDLARTKADPKHHGFNLPIILASGETWEEVKEALIRAGEMEG